MISSLQTFFKERQNLRHVLANSFWLYADRIVRMGIGFAVAVWLARYLGSTNYGTLQYAISFVGLFGMLSSLGLQGIVMREVVKHPHQHNSIIGSAFAVRFMGGMLSIAAVFVASHLFITDTDTSLLMVVAVGQLFLAFNTIQLWFDSQLRSKSAVVAQWIAFAVITLGNVAGIVLGMPLIVFAAIIAGAQIANAIALVVVYQRTNHSITQWQPTVVKSKGLLLMSWPLILSGIGEVIYLKIDQVMLGSMLDKAQVGIYAVAVQLSEVWYFIPVALATSLLPTFTKLFAEKSETYHLRIQQALDGVVVLSVAIAIVMSVLADPLMNLLYGAEYMGSGQVLSIHIWAAIFVFMGAILSKWLIVEDYLLFSLWRHLGGAVMNIGLNIVLIPEYGVVGAAFATVVSYATASYVMCWVSPRTRPIAIMMTKALALPLRLVLKRGKLYAL